MSEVEVNMQVASSSAKFNTDGRTDERTKMVVTDVDHLSVVTARANHDRMATLNEILTNDVLRERARHERTRTGPREPLPKHVRAAVWYRDRGRCELCPYDQRQITGEWECDHITPWSAGGSDDTTNLRVLCSPHNQERSNFIDPHERPRRPATWWCVNCYSETWDHTPNGIPLCPTHSSTPSEKHPFTRCRVMAAHWRALTADEPMPTWHNRLRVDEPTVVAYCVHCGIPALTDKPL